MREEAVEQRLTEVAAVLDSIGLESSSVAPMSRSRRCQNPLYLIKANDGTFVLKLKRPVHTRRQALRRRVMGSPTFQRQLAVYRALDRERFSSLRYPRLVATDNETFMLLEYIHGPDPSPAPRSNAYMRTLVDCLIEYQTVPLRGKQQRLGYTGVSMALSPTSTYLRTALTKMRYRHGITISARCLRAFWTCNAGQPSQAAPIWLHNDFHHNNVLVGVHGELYFTDFEQTSEERKWVLVDIVHYATDAYAFSINLDVIRHYVEQLKEVGSFATPLDYGAQLRFALLLRSMQHVVSMAPPQGVKQQYLSFISDVLLDDAAYYDWHTKHALL